MADTGYLLEQVLRVRDFYIGTSIAYPDSSLVTSVLSEFGKFCESVALPLNGTGDREGCRRDRNGGVTTPSGFKEAYCQAVANGWPTLGAPEEFGGQGLPRTVSTACNEFLFAANIAFAGYFGLTRSAIDALIAKGSDSQKATYLPKMVTGEWSGTMNLTEPQCGTDLGLIQTKAVASEDGSYLISGTKIFISSGEHDLTDNIIHLVLATMPGAPGGVKGLSLFVVPKYLTNDDGSLGPRNNVTCDSIEEKMGFHGNATCVMTYEDASGWLVGEENAGLAAMFIMMNSARLEVGLQALGIAEIAYQNAVGYAKSRRQGRAPGGPAEKEEKADLILFHPDVRRMLLEAKAGIGAARALCLWAALQEDIHNHGTDPEVAMVAGEFLSLVTPVIKAAVTDLGYKVATDCQTVFGGHGYIREVGVEQFVRDVRITMLYEGTNGVQAGDLVRRKVQMNDGRVLGEIISLIRSEICNTPAVASAFAHQMEAALQDLEAATTWMVDNKATDANHGPAGAYSYLLLTSLVLFGWMWLKMAHASAASLLAGKGDPAFHRGKLATARFFGERMLPDTVALRRKIIAGADALMALDSSAF